MLAALAGVLAGCGGPEARRRQGTFGVPDTTAETTDGRPTVGDPTTVDDPGTTIRGVDPGKRIAVPDAARRAVTSEPGPARQFVLTERTLTTTRASGRLTAGFLEPPSPAGPARLWIRFTNSSGRRGPFDFGPSPPFSHYWATRVGGRPDERAFLLVPDDDRPFPYEGVVPDVRTEGRWVAADRLGTPEGSVEEYTISLDPGESIAGTYSLLVHPDAVPLPERGVYQFDGGFWTEGSLGLSVFRPSLSEPGTSRFDPGREVPPFRDGFPTRWYHRTSAQESATTFLRPGTERLRIDEDEAGLAVENYAPWTVRVGPWYLFKRHRGEWRRIAPWGPADPPDGVGPVMTRPVPPGGRVRRSFVPGGSTGSDPESYAPGLRVGGLGAGTYALRVRPVEVGGPGPDVPVAVDEDGPARGATGVRRVALAALLELTGPAAEVTLDADRVEVTRDGPTVTVRGEGRYGRKPAVGPELVVRRVEAAGDAPTLLTEQVNQFPALRNALAVFEDGVETVRVATASSRVRSVLDRLAPDADRLRFVHRDRAYEARVEDAVAPEGPDALADPGG